MPTQAPTPHSNRVLGDEWCSLKSNTLLQNDIGLEANVPAYEDSRLMIQYGYEIDIDYDMIFVIE